MTLSSSTPTQSTGPGTGREWATALVAGAALVLLLTYPTIAMFATGGRVESGDGQFSIWNVGWVAHALLTAPARVLDANIFYPHQGTLSYSELNLVAGVMGVPVLAATGNAVAAHNAALILAFYLSFVAMWAFVRHLTGSAPAGLVSATAFTFCPFVQVHHAHIQLVMLFAFPLVFLAFHRLRDTPSIRTSVELGLALALAGLACAYYGIFAGLGMGLLALILARASVRYWTTLAVAAVVMVVTVAPIFVPYVRARAAVGATSPRTMEEAQGWSATWATYTSSPAWTHKALPGIENAFESVFPGVLVILLAGFGVWTVWRSRARHDWMVVAAYLVLGAVALWASFGPAAGLYAWLASVIPPMGFLRTPVRFGVLVVFALAVLAGYGARRLAQVHRLLPALVVALLALELSAVPWPLRETPPPPRAYEILRNLPSGPVIEFPFAYEHRNFWTTSQYMFNSTYHWMPLVNGYSDVIPVDYYGLASAINAFPDDATFQVMKAKKVRYVLWHVGRNGYTATEQQALLDRMRPYSPYLRRVTASGGAWLYEIIGYPGDQAQGSPQ